MYEAGQILHDRYQLQRRLGRTAAGRQTWLATDLESAQSEAVVLKLLAFGLQMEWQEFELFEREAKILKALDHPQIPRYRDYFSIDPPDASGISWFILVQDAILGTSLQDLLDQGHHFSQKQVRSIAKQLLQILQYLHELSPPVLHRDIKPGNVILAYDQQAYLVDFGAVQDKAMTTGVSFTVVGTSGYAPLEQFYGRAVPASDLYALGSTLIHLLTGTNPIDLLQNDGSLGFRDRVNLDPHCLTYDWLQHLTALNLEKRFKSAREALKGLQQPQPQSVVRPRFQAESPVHSQSRNSESEQMKIARLELENGLLRLDRDWEHEQDNYKVRYSKNSEPVLPRPTTWVGLVIKLGLILVAALFIARIFPFQSFLGPGLAMAMVFILGDHFYFWWRYQTYQEALNAYEIRREALIARYQRQKEQ